MRFPALKRLLSPRRRAIRRADRARDRGDAARAATLYGEVIRRYGRDQFGVLVQYGNALKDSADYERADLVYLEATALRPDDADVFIQRGHLSKLAGRERESAGHFRRALELDPISTVARTELDRLGTGTLVSSGIALGDLPLPVFRPDLPLPVSVIRHRLVRQYRWRRG